MISFPIPSSMTSQKSQGKKTIIVMLGVVGAMKNLEVKFILHSDEATTVSTHNELKLGKKCNLTCVFEYLVV